MTALLRNKSKVVTASLRYLGSVIAASLQHESNVDTASLQPLWLDCESCSRVRVRPDCESWRRITALISRLLRE